MKLNSQKVVKEISNLLEKVTKREVLTSSDDVPIAINILKLLELYAKGNFYGEISIKLVGVSSRNLKIQQQTFKLLEEKKDYFLDN